MIPKPRISRDLSLRLFLLATGFLWAGSYVLHDITAVHRQVIALAVILCIFIFIIWWILESYSQQWYESRADGYKLIGGLYQEVDDEFERALTALRNELLGPNPLAGDVWSYRNRGDVAVVRDAREMLQRGYLREDHLKAQIAALEELVKRQEPEICLKCFWGKQPAQSFEALISRSSPPRRVPPRRHPSPTRMMPMHLRG